MMLVRVADGPAVVCCTTCRHSDTAVAADGIRGGARLAAELDAVKAADPDRYVAVAVQEMRCLFACADHCTVHLRAPGRIGYVLGRFTPDTEAARAILDYAVLHAQSDEGEVDYRLWPEGVKGHFITRTPPEGFVAS